MDIGGYVRNVLNMKTYIKYMYVGLFPEKDDKFDRIVDYLHAELSLIMKMVEAGVELSVNCNTYRLQTHDEAIAQMYDFYEIDTDELDGK